MDPTCDVTWSFDTDNDNVWAYCQKGESPVIIEHLNG